MDSAFDLVEMISSGHAESRLILGIDGLSRSGKSTFVRKLGQILEREGHGFHIFHIDDHIVERARRYETGFEEWHEYFHLQWDVEWLVKHFFQKLKDKEQVTLPFYQGYTDTHESKTIQLPQEGLIIIEGVFLQRKEWRHFFDKIVYLDCPRKTRFDRESQATKHHLSKFENRYWKAEEYYVKHYNPAESADLVIST